MSAHTSEASYPPGRQATLTIVPLVRYSLRFFLGEILRLFTKWHIPCIWDLLIICCAVVLVLVSVISWFILPLGVPRHLGRPVDQIVVGLTISMFIVYALHGVFKHDVASLWLCVLLGLLLLAFPILYTLFGAETGSLTWKSIALIGLGALFFSVLVCLVIAQCRAWGYEGSTITAIIEEYRSGVCWRFFCAMLVLDLSMTILLYSQAVLIIRKTHQWALPFITSGFLLAFPLAYLGFIIVSAQWALGQAVWVLVMLAEPAYTLYKLYSIWTRPAFADTLRGFLSCVVAADLIVRGLLFVSLIVLILRRDTLGMYIIRYYEYHGAQLGIPTAFDQSEQASTQHTTSQISQPAEPGTDSAGPYQELYEPLVAALSDADST